MLSQSQSQARDLAEQMGQRLKVNEALLAEAVKARERLVADNESAVEGLLATISSKDQLLKVNTHTHSISLEPYRSLFNDGAFCLSLARPPPRNRLSATTALCQIGRASCRERV